MINLNKKILLKFFLFITLAETIATFFILVSIPADIKNAVLWGFSKSRLLVLSFISLSLFFTTVILGYVSTSETRMQFILNKTDDLFNNSKVIYFTWGMVITLIAGISFLLTPPARDEIALFERLLPIVVWVVLLSVQTLFFQFVWLERKINLTFMKQWKIAYISTSIVLLFVSLVWAFVASSNIGIVEEKSGWHSPGTPVLPQQVLLALGIGFLFFIIKSHQRMKDFKKLDVIVSIILWCVASILWLNEPLQDWSYFTRKPTPPNFEIYPYSDSATYDTFAQNYLIGESLYYGLTPRPGYSMFLALLHALAGQEYEAVITLQVVIFALAPAAMYLLVSKLGGRAAGVVAALMIIFREKNSIALTNIIEVSHSKLFMSDLPTMICILIFVLFLITWFQSSENKFHLAILAGAGLGLTALIRSQALIYIPIVLLFILIAKRKSIKIALLQGMLFLIGVLLIIAPWVWRNYQISGRTVIEYQNFYTTVIAGGYTDTPEAVAILPNETVDQYDERMFAMIRSYIIRNPLEVARFITSYFIHNDLSSIVHFPMAATFWNPSEYVKQINIWGWQPVFTKPTFAMLPFFIMTLCLIGFGIGVAYQKTKWIGLIPLCFHLAYNLSVVPFKISGWRFILPVDWVLTLYFSIGLMHVAIILFSLFTQTLSRNESNKLVEAKKIEYPKLLSTITIFLVIGLAFPWIEKSIPRKYSPLSSEEVLKNYFTENIIIESTNITVADLENFVETEPTAMVVYGRALYPSFYESGDFWGDDDAAPLEFRAISRLQFELIGPISSTVYIPLISTPSQFPHVSDVFVIGCKTQAGIRALFVKLKDSNTLVYSSTFENLTCN